MANKEVDSRIVEMQFDAKDFDKNIRQSTKNLDDFKKSLNFEDAAKQMQGAIQEGNSLSDVITNMAHNVGKLASELTGIGSVSSFVAQKVKTAWHNAANSVTRFMKSLTTDQISEGKNKYDELLKSVQTIKNATGDSESYVYDIMEKLNKYTDETSYNFSDMAQNIGKFTTVGVKLEDAEIAMEGIANWAALSGQNAQTASRAMYNISQAMSSTMRMQDWRSIQNASMDTRQFREEALKAAAAVGTLTKKGDQYFTKGNKLVNIDNFTETLQYKWFDKATMMEVFKTFADNTQGIGKEAYKAAQRCTTLKDAIGAWKDMISTSWMKSYEYIFGKLGDAMALFSGLCNKVGESLQKFIDFRNGILEHWSLTGRNSLWGALVGELESPDGDTLFKGAYGLLDILQAIGDAVLDLEHAIYDGFWDFVGMFIDPLNKELFEQNREEYGMNFLAAGLQTLTSSFKEFTEKIRNFLFEADPGETETRFDRLRHLASAIFAVVTLAVNIAKGIVQFVREILGQLHPAFHAIEQLIDFLLQLFTGAVANGVKKNTIGNAFHQLAEGLKPLTTIINVAVVGLAKLIAWVAAMIKQSGILPMIGAALQGLGNIFAKIINKVISSGVLPKIFSWIQNGISKLPALTAKIRSLAKTLASSFKNSKAYQGISEFLKKLFDGKTLQAAVGSAKKSVADFLKKIPSLLPTIKSTLKDLFGKISEMIGNFFRNIFGGAKAEGGESATKEIAMAVVEPFKALGSGPALSEVMEEVKPGLLDNIKNKLSEIWNAISGFFTSIANSDAMKKIKSFFSGTTFMGLLDGAKDLMKWLAIFRGGSGLVSLGKGIKSVGKGFKAFSKNMKNLNLSNIFSNMFSNMFNLSNIINSNNSDSSIRKSFDFGKLGNQLLEIAGAILIVVLAAKQIAAMDSDELKQAGIGLAAVIGGLVLAGTLAKKFTGKGASLMALAAGVLILMIPLKIVQRMDWPTLLDGVEKLAVIVAILAGAAWLSHGNKMGGFVSMAAAVNLLLIPLKVLSNMPLLSDSGKLTPLMQGLLALGSLMLLMGTAARLAEGNKMKGMISLAAALTILLIPIKVIGNMEIGKAAQGVVALLMLITGITAMIKITDGAKASKLAGIVAAITALSLVAWLVGHTMDWKQALIGFVPIIAMLGFMGIMLKQASRLNAEQLKALKGIFTAFAVTIAIIATAIILMKEFDIGWEIPVAFMGGIVAMLIGLGFVLKQAARTDAASLGKLIRIMIAVDAMVVVAGGALIMMSQYNINWETIISFLGGLTLLIAGLGWALPKLANITPKGAIVGILALAVAVVAIMGAIGLMMPYLLGSAGNALEEISEKLKTMSGLLKDFFERMDLISEESANHAKIIFEILKSMVLGFAGFTALSAPITAFRNQLLNLAAGLDMFFLNEKNYPDPENSVTIKTLNKLMEMSPALSAFSAGTVPDQLLYLGVGLGLFHEATKDITNTNPPALELLQGIFGQTGNIEAFAKLPLDTFSSQMSSLGGAMSLYAKGAQEVTGIKTEGNAPDISGSVEILKSVCRAISGESGEGEFKIPENMPDSTKLGLFAGQLEALGNALSTFATAAKSMETDTGNATALLGFLAEIGGYVTADNLAVVNAFDSVGHVDANGKGGKLGQFAMDIGALGTALSSFAKDIGGKKSDFDTGLSVLGKFQDLNQKLTADNLKFVNAFKDAGIEGTGGANSVLTQFAGDIGALGHAIASFAENSQMTDGTQADFSYALKALNFLVTMKNRLPDTGGLQELIHGHKLGLDEVGDELQGLGQSMKDFSDKITGTGGIDYEAITKTFDILSAVTNLANMLMMVNPETGNIYGAGYMVMELGTMMSAINDGMNEFGIAPVAEKIATFAAGISKAFSQTGDINTEALQGFANIAKGLKDLATMDPSLNFEYPGQMIAKGIADGIRRGESEVVNAIVEVVTAGIDAGNKTADIDSPSKVFMAMGEFMDQGLIKGLLGKQDDVEKASGTMTQTALDKAAGVMGLISRAMADSVDMQPTITPVLDLSNITGAGNALDRLFGGYSLNLDGTLSRANAATQKSGPTEVVIQNPTDISGIQGSIVDLQTQIVNLQNAITNMKIVLNTGVVAGGVTDDVDLNLGRKSLYASRRN